MIKVKVHEISKNFDISSKDILGYLEAQGLGGKKSMSVLEEHEADILLEIITQKFDTGADVESLYAVKEAAKEQSVNVAEISEEEIGPKEAEVRARHVDTRANTVDLSKITDDKIEELVSDIQDDSMEKKQKIKKGGPVVKAKRPEDLQKQQNKQVQPKVKKELITITIPEGITVSELAEKLGVGATEVIKRLMLLGTIAGINDPLEFDMAALLAEDLGAKAEKEIIITQEDRLFNDTEDANEQLKTRPPVVVVMGHVDHGKTSLLDAIRKTNVTEKEAGGITQHIGAYSVNINNRAITFLDTPGHAAFTAMRARGAQATDIAILVVAADDGIMPQTVEAINHAKAAGVKIIVAINKMDKPDANPERIKQELTEHELLAEEWGGDIICVPVSAKQGMGIDLLLEMILLVADMEDYKANPDRLAKGTVVEAKLDKGRGPVATVLVQNGTLKSGDLIVAGTSIGKIRAMVDDKGHKVKKAGPSMPVEIIGLSEVPVAGDIFYAVENEKMAKDVVEKRKFKEKEDVFSRHTRVTLDDLFNQISQGEVKDLNIIIKADVQGSVEAVRGSLDKLSNDEVRVKIIHGGVGAINENDIALADASNAIIVGFNVRPNAGAVSAAQIKGVDVRTYRVIYEAIEQIEAAMKGMLAPKFKEIITGHAEVRQTFKVTGVGTIAGCYMTDGKISRNTQVRIVRDGIVIHEGVLDTLKRFKDDVKEVAEGYECGICIERFNDIKEGDIIEGFAMEEIKS